MAMNAETLQLIHHAERLVSVFGRWPSFHDAAVLSILIESEGPTVTVRFRLNEALDDSLETDYLGLVTLQWDEVEDFELKGIDQGENNWIWGLEIVADEGWMVGKIEEMDGTHGFIRAKQIEVLDVDPIEKA